MAKFSTLINSPASFRDTCRPIVWTKWLLGMSVMEIPEGRPRILLSIIYATVKWLGYGYLFWYGMSIKDHRMDNIPSMISTFDFILYANIVIAVLSTAMGLLHFKRRELIVKKIKLIDETLGHFGIDPQYSVEFKDNMKFVVVWYAANIFIISTNFVIACYVYRSMASAIAKTIIYEMPLLLNPIVELDFFIMIRTLGKRFERLNALLQSIVISPLQSVNSTNFNKYQNILNKFQNKIEIKTNNYIKNRSNVELLLRTTRQLHLNLCMNSREVNDICSRQMSMLMATKFLLVTGFTYCIYLIYNEPTMLLSHKIQLYISLGIRIVISIFRMIIIVRVSVDVTSEAQNTSQIAHEIQVSKSKNNLITDEIHQLSLQIMQRPLFFTASGLLVLDFGYVRGFVGSVTTYLMILIQAQPDMLKAASTLADSNKNISMTVTPLP